MSDLNDYAFTKHLRQVVRLIGLVNHTYNIKKKQTVKVLITMICLT